MSPAAVTVNGQYRGVLSRFRGGGVASDNVAVLLAVRWPCAASFGTRIVRFVDPVLILVLFSSIRRPRAAYAAPP